jgi:hypothetical protein
MLSSALHPLSHSLSPLTTSMSHPRVVEWHAPVSGIDTSFVATLFSDRIFLAATQQATFGTLVSRRRTRHTLCSPMALSPLPPSALPPSHSLPSPAASSLLTLMLTLMAAALQLCASCWASERTVSC